MIVNCDKTPEDNDHYSDGSGDVPFRLLDQYIPSKFNSLWQI